MLPGMDDRNEVMRLYDEATRLETEWRRAEVETRTLPDTRRDAILRDWRMRYTRAMRDYHAARDREAYG